MSGSELAITAALLLSWPLLVLAHELGHAFAALRFTTGRVRVEVGSSHRRFVRAGRRLTICFSPLGAGGICRPERPPPTRRAAFWIVLAGPAVDLTVLILLLPAAAITSSGTRAVLAPLAFLAALNVLSDLIPKRTTLPTHGGQFSDALQAWSLLREEPLRHDRRLDRSRGSSNSELVAIVAGVCLGAVMVNTHTLDHVDPLPWAIAIAVYLTQAIVTVRRSQHTVDR